MFYTISISLIIHYHLNVQKKWFSMTKTMNEKPKKKIIERFLDGVEKAGNKLPDPVTLFVIMAFLILGLSWIMAKFNVSAVKPGTDESIAVINLLNQEGLIRIL